MFLLIDHFGLTHYPLESNGKCCILGSVSLSPIFLGIECGGTRTVALASDAKFRELGRLELGPANLRLSSDWQLNCIFQEIFRRFPGPSAVGVGIAGARTAEDVSRVNRILSQVWPGRILSTTHDLESAWHAADFDDSEAPSASRVRQLRVLVLSGTGSCCFGRNSAGKSAKVGGWGHVLGDRGSAYDIVYRGLRASIQHFDRTGKWGKFVPRILRALQVNDPEALPAWIGSAEKSAIAALAPEVFAAARDGDKVVRTILADTILTMADDAESCWRQLGGSKRGGEFVLSGSVLLNQKLFSRRLAAELSRRLPQASVRSMPREAVWGSILVVSKLWASQTVGGRLEAQHIVEDAAALDREIAREWIPRATKPSPTEGRNPRSTGLDTLPVANALKLHLSEEATVTKAVGAAAPEIVSLVEMVAASFKNGGRLFYVGAGTSGRLGVLDASECPPTFRTSPDQVQGIMAGGVRALYAAVEGAEDDFGAGRSSVLSRNVGSNDVVVGLAASGRTPFVWGALNAAHWLKARTAIITCQPHLTFDGGFRPDSVIVVNTGPEILTGSTRLKAGTATKIVLNAVSTLSMIQLGKVASNLMSDLNPSNVKLRDRACRIVSQLAGVPVEAARAALESSGWVVEAAARALGWSRHR